MVLVLFLSAALAFNEYSLSALIIMYICSYNRQDDEKSAKSKFANIFSIIMNPSEYVFVGTISLGRFAFISYGDTSDVLSRS